MRAHVAKNTHKKLAEELAGRSFIAAVRDALSHLVVQNGVTDAAVVEARLTAADGSTFDADVVFFDPSYRARVILEVSIVTIGSDTSLGRGA